MTRLAQVARPRHRPRPGRGWRATAAALALLLASGCGPSAGDPRAEIEAVIDAAVAAAEARDYRSLGAMLADDYEDAAGRDPHSAALYLRALFIRYPGVVVARRGLQIELLSPVLARAQVDLVVVARRRGAPLPVAVEAESFRLRVALRRDGGAWRVTRADPEPRLAD